MGMFCETKLFSNQNYKKSLPQRAEMVKYDSLEFLQFVFQRSGNCFLLHGHTPDWKKRNGY